MVAVEYPGTGQTRPHRSLECQLLPDQNGIVAVDDMKDMVVVVVVVVGGGGGGGDIVVSVEPRIVVAVELDDDSGNVDIVAADIAAVRDMMRGHRTSMLLGQCRLCHKGHNHAPRCCHHCPFEPQAVGI